MNYLPDDLLFTIFVYSDIKEIIGIPEFKVKLANNWKLLFTLYFTHIDINQVEMIDYSMNNFDYYFIIFCKLQSSYDIIMTKYLKSVTLKYQLTKHVNHNDTVERQKELIEYHLNAKSTVWTFNMVIINNIKLFLDILEQDHSMYKMFLSIIPNPFYKYSNSGKIEVKVVGDKISLQFEVSIYGSLEYKKLVSKEIDIQMKRGVSVPLLQQRNQ